MKNSTREILKSLTERYPSLTEQAANIEKAFDIIKSTYLAGGKVLLCGNGGSAADCEHIVGELVKSFKIKREIDTELCHSLCDFGEDGEYLARTLEGGLPAIALTTESALVTAFSNDRAWDAAFAQEVLALGKRGDCLISISTSGNSRNCVLATITAAAKGIYTVALTGDGGGRLGEISDVTVAVPEKETYKVQELHLPTYHALCAMIENELF